MPGKGLFMEHYIAIDNVCAWPNLTLLPDGTIAAVIYNQPHHAGWEGDVDCWISEDSGCRWKFRSTVARHEPTTNRMNVAAGLVHDGSFIVIASGWLHRVPPGGIVTDEYCGKGKILPPVVCRSYDNGNSWITDGKVENQDGLPYLVPFGDIVRLPGGVAGASFYWEDTSFLFQSADNGKTWTKLSEIGRNCNETALLALEDGQILAAARTRDGAVDFFSSPDAGKSWQRCGRITQEGQHPAHILHLADGSILLQYGVRNYGYWGVACRVSRDNGKTWSWPFRLLHLEEGNFDCGYPSSIQSADGTIITAYYAATSRWHKRYHMGVIRWRMKEKYLAEWYGEKDG